MSNQSAWPTKSANKFDSEAVKSDGASRRVQHVVIRWHLPAYTSLGNRRTVFCEKLFKLRKNVGDFYAQTYRISRKYKSAHEQIIRSSCAKVLIKSVQQLATTTNLCPGLRGGRWGGNQRDCLAWILSKLFQIYKVAALCFCTKT